MGSGTEAARAMGAVVGPQIVDDFKDQLLIAFLKRLGGMVEVAVREVDETGRYMVDLQVLDAGQTFRFVLQQKQ
jgi:hypothetical protein